MSKLKPLYLEDTVAGPKAGTFLANISDLPEHGGKDIVFRDGTHQTNIFIQLHKGTVHIYENRCPHAGTPLNMIGDKFLNITKDRLICRTHGALFEIQNGNCVAGPCKGQGLRPVAFDVKDGAIFSA
jgi:nitrite reductase/ring-hydroxylating ferredoxin subunit